MSTYRDTATALMQRAPGNFLGVALYVPVGDMPAQWNAVALMNPQALKEWYEEIAGAPTLYYYLAAFDKTRSQLPVGETIAPPKRNDPEWAAFALLQRSGYQWRPNPFVFPTGPTRPTVSGADDVDVGPGVAGRVAKAGLVVGLVFFAGLLYSTATTSDYRRAIAQMPFPPKRVK